MENLPENEFTVTREVLDAAREKAFSYGATPLGNGEVTKQQLEIFEQLSGRIDEARPDWHGKDMKWLHEFMHLSHMSRAFARADRNLKGFDDRLERDLSKVSPEIMAKAWAGAASPGELLTLQNKLQVSSIELARVSHPYGVGVEDTLEEMRDAVLNDILSDPRIDDCSFPETPPRYKARNSNSIMASGGEQGPKGILMTRKTDIAHFADDTLVIERSSFVLVLDQLRAYAPDFVRNVNSINLREVGPDGWVEVVTDMWNEASLPPGLIEDNNFDAVVPLSTTTYAYNRSLQEEISIRDAENKAIRELENPNPDWLIEARLEAGSDKVG